MTATGAVPVTAVDTTSYDLALQEARRSNDQQFADLGAVRANATAVFALALGVLLFAPLDDQPHWYIRTATIIVAAISGLWVNICWPRVFVFTHNPAVIVGWAESDDKPSTQEQTRNLALFMGKYYDENRVKLARLVLWYQGCVLLLALEIAWLLASLP
jgi:hypothetical protein